MMKSWWKRVFSRGSDTHAISDPDDTLDPEMPVLQILEPHAPPSTSMRYVPAEAVFEGDSEPIEGTKPPPVDEGPPQIQIVQLRLGEKALWREVEDVGRSEPVDGLVDTSEATRHADALISKLAGERPAEAPVETIRTPVDPLPSPEPTEKGLVLRKASLIPLDSLERNAAFRMLPTFLGIGAPLLVFVAMFAVVLLGRQIEATTSQWRSALKAEENAATYAVVRQPVPKPTLARIARVLASTHPAVDVKVNNKSDGLLLSITEPEAFTQWQHALQSLQAYQRNLAWEASELCLGNVCDGLAARADVTAFIQSFEQKISERKR